jgi:hypothetical protein
MNVSVSTVTTNRTNWPNWNQRGRIRAVDQQGHIIEGKYAFNGEAVRISPRYQRNGQNYRVRPERPAAFFAAWCYEHGLLPTLLTAEECEQEAMLELLDPLWEQYKVYFLKLESPMAACDTNTVPSHRNGFSFNVAQVLVEHLGTVRPVGSAGLSQPPVPASNVSKALDLLKKKIDEVRARTPETATPNNPPTPAKAKK